MASVSWLLLATFQRRNWKEIIISVFRLLPAKGCLEMMTTLFDLCRRKAKVDNKNIEYL